MIEDWRGIGYHNWPALSKMQRNDGRDAVYKASLTEALMRQKFEQAELDLRGGRKWRRRGREGEWRT